MSVQDDLDPNSVGVEFIKEGADWWVTFNPEVPRQMDVKLVNKFVHEKVVCSVKFSVDTNSLAVAVGSDGVVLLYDLVGGQNLTFPLEDVPNTRNYVRGVAFSPDGKYLASGSEDRLVRVWSLKQGTLLHQLRGHRGEVYAVDFSSDGNTLLSASGDRTVRVWDVAHLTEDDSDTVERSCRVLKVNESTKSDVAFTSVSISQDSRYVAAGSLDGVIRVWDLIAIPEDAAELEGAKLVDRLRGHEKSVYSVKFVHGHNARDGGDTLISGSLDKTLKRWEVGPFDTADVARGTSPAAEGAGENGSTCVKTYRGHNDYVLAAATVKEGQYYRLASASRDGSVRLWDLKTGVAQFMIQGHKNTVTSLDLSPDGRQLVTGSGDCEVRICESNLNLDIQM